MLRLNRPVPVILPMVGKIAVQTGKECMTRIKPAVQSYEQRQYFTIHMSRLMTKPTKWLCGQRRLRSAWAFAQSDQSLRCALYG